jgi:hypothetical protein
MGRLLLCCLGVVYHQWGATPSAHCSLALNWWGFGEYCDSFQTHHTHLHHTCTRICDGVHSWLWTGTNLNAVFRCHFGLKADAACSRCLCAVLPNAMDSCQLLFVFLVLSFFLGLHTCFVHLHFRLPWKLSFRLHFLYSLLYNSD